MTVPPSGTGDTCTVNVDVLPTVAELGAGVTVIVVPTLEIPSASEPVSAW